MIIWMVIHNEARHGVMPHAVDKLHLLILAICLRLLCILIVPQYYLCSIINTVYQEASKYAFFWSQGQKNTSLINI